MFFNDTNTSTTSDFNNYPINYAVFSESSMAMAPGRNSDMVPTDFIYPNYNLNHYINTDNNSSNNQQLPIQYSATGPHEMIGFTNLRKPSAPPTSSSSSSLTTPRGDVSAGPGAGPQQYTPWNIEIAFPSSSSTSSNASAQLQLTSAPFTSIPAKSAPSTSTTTVAWTNESTLVGEAGEGGGSHRSKQQQRQQGARGSHQFQAITSFDSGIASMYPHISGSHPGLDLSAAVASMAPHTSSCITSPVPQAAMSSHFQSQPQYLHHPSSSWGMTAAMATNSSPVESCFNSGSSTPSFGSSMSPTLSYSSFELASSGDSSRATSPSQYNNQHQHYQHHHHHSTPYDSFDHGHRRRDSESSSSLTIRSRKSSTSSTSSNNSQRRVPNLRESTLPSTPANNTTSNTTTVSSPTHQCPTCNICFAGPAVLVRHIESIHDKLLWNCVGCKSNLSRRDAVTRHINLSPMDSICRNVGTIGQIKMLHGSEVQYEVSSYKAKPLDEVMTRMGKKISAAQRQEIDRAKANAAAAAVAAANAVSVADPIVANIVAMGAHHHHQQQQQHDYGFSEDIMARLRETTVGSTTTSALLEMDEELMKVGGGQYEEEMEYESDGSQKKRRRPFQHTIGQRKK
ncbi:hypothetical protein BGZ95_000532 [Linnemannia exigua]|uniref:C2H2-type domain-containing protein n=1 Tax=Linnemannia exigua TaxID=604196 RepID=A0AAD4HAB3_9FUNG|nr:hypothetical protein BGZ95_000532 [Linnemannia exigua]